MEFKSLSKVHTSKKPTHKLVYCGCYTSLTENLQAPFRGNILYLPTMEANHDEPTTANEADVEKPTSCDAHASAFKGLGWLDRLLALWILLAMITGVLLGNFVPNVGLALQRGTFVGVSIPIGACPSRPSFF